LFCSIDEKFASRFHGRRPHAFNYRHRLALELDEDWDFSAKREVGKLNDRSGENSGNACIYRIAAALEHAHPRFDCERMSAGNNSAFAAHNWPKCLSRNWREWNNAEKTDDAEQGHQNSSHERTSGGS
jgi:hypothetical protein